MKPESSIAIILIGTLLVSCLTQEGPDILSVDRASRLIALDTGKVWQLIAKKIDREDITPDECEKSNIYSFDFVNNSDTLFYIALLPGCGTKTPDTLQHWSWEVIGNVREQFKDSLRLIDGSGSEMHRSILHLSANTMEWEFEEDGRVIQEQFTWIRDSGIN